MSAAGGNNDGGVTQRGPLISQRSEQRELENNTE
jgi:hypothetical protein